ncbi:low molecular weight protein-tyrosine-phosphatase [Puniceicoccus vermicola]|uniref:Low molecular weight phosphotyrosine protein phosphatase n=1 Tax=Puniceicoccus vermicola TaxID=388746 RepID=A0A7X1B0E9_9BACT|nr:low molecular weight protein-tyrosine-phosphatase [Puniceicoccus vermicola]MBC2602248.1 low molecular weight phosphotyrosine protein phosphatase [Puniceicoccus vermicola]
MIRVLFVCMGNICRSPAAEGIFRKNVHDAEMGDEITCDSAGTIDFHAGDPADSRMRRAARTRGYELSSIARGFRVEDFDRFDWIVTMDDENYRNIQALAPDENARNQVRRFCDWVSLPNVTEVPDPYYGGDKGFENVLDILENGSKSLLTWVTNNDGVSG